MMLDESRPNLRWTEKRPSEYVRSTPTLRHQQQGKLGQQEHQVSYATRKEFMKQQQRARHLHHFPTNQVLSPPTRLSTQESLLARVQRPQSGLDREPNEQSLFSRKLGHSVRGHHRHEQHQHHQHQSNWLLPIMIDDDSSTFVADEDDPEPQHDDDDTDKRLIDESQRRITHSLSDFHHASSLSCVDSSAGQYWAPPTAATTMNNGQLNRSALALSYRPSIPAKPSEVSSTALQQQQSAIYYQPNLYHFTYFKQQQQPHYFKSSFPDTKSQNPLLPSSVLASTSSSGSNQSDRYRKWSGAGSIEKSSTASNSSAAPTRWVTMNSASSQQLSSACVANQRERHANQNQHQASNYQLKVPTAYSMPRKSPDGRRRPNSHEHSSKSRSRRTDSKVATLKQQASSQLTLCGKFAKLLLFLANLLFWSAGLALGAWGILSLVDDHKYNISQLLVFEAGNKMSLFQLLSWSFITLGCATILVGFCGCSAMFKNNRWILGLYIFLILAIFALDLATGLLAIIFQERLVANVRLRLANKLRSDYGVQASFTAAIDYIQTRFECCGLDGHFDYDQSLWRLQRLGGFDATVARTCCHLRNTVEDQAHINPRPVNESMCQSTDVRFHQSYRYRKGCMDDLERLIRQKIWTFTIGCGAVGGVILLSLLFATCYCRSISGSSSRKSSATSDEETSTKSTVASIKHKIDAQAMRRSGY